ncbi:Suppressor of the cold-sensitive snRNP bioproteinsis mutant brr1-1 [Perkinsus olseni]|uniref:subtilisin n=1 Tax=Perkinsus olseni TaxID=32597 RepID=A0A7J6M5D8_PEROL|nr:Suppressor of the cold-sensitive snRNP bioproteinsis mutant brr1-1 [Perkinsus olseni]KAF4671952.1 Suppressor of the cold-sensitive snRNP bioproteinsis mutant brr1-1 [Perkinsus olseni]
MLTLGVQVIDTGSILCNVTRQEMYEYLSSAAETLEVKVLCDPNVEFEPATGFTGTEKKKKKERSTTTTATTPTPTGPTLSKLGVDDKFSDRQWNLEAIGAESLCCTGGVRGYNFHDNNNDTSDVLLDHGTFVAGIIGATTNNTIGLAGIADLKMMPINVTNSEGSAPLAELAKGLNYALDDGAKVSCIAFASSGPSPVLEKAIERAAQLGHLVVTAAGNGGRDITQRKRFPCAYTERLDALCVAGSDERGRLAHRSNFASYVDIAAPRTRIWSAGIHNKYFRDSGTSAATAHVAGVVSLLYGMDHPLRIVISALVKVVDVLLDSSGRSLPHFGVVNAKRTVEWAEIMATFPPTASPKSTTQSVPWTTPTTASTLSPNFGGRN